MGKIDDTLTGPTGAINALSQTKSGLVLSASSDTTLIVWNLVDGTKKILNTLHPLTSVSELSNGVIAAGGSTGYLYFWYENMTLITSFAAHTDEVTCFVSMANGTFITGSKDKTLMMWELTYTNISLNTKNVGEEINSLLILDNGWLAVSTGSNTVQLWNITISGFLFVKELLQSKILNVNLNGMAQLPNGLLVTASDDTSIKLWDVNTGSLLKSLQGHSGSVQSVAVTSDGLIISASYDTSIKVWSTDIDLEYH